MQQQTVPVNPNANVLVHAVHGDLRVAGWDRNELMVKTDPAAIWTWSPAPFPITISCDEDVILYLPRSSHPAGGESHRGCQPAGPQRPGHPRTRRPAT